MAGPHLDPEEVGRLLESAFDTHSTDKLVITILQQISGQLDRLSTRGDTHTDTLNKVSERVVQLEAMNFTDVSLRLRKLEDERERRDGAHGLAGWLFKNGPTLVTWLFGGAIVAKLYLA